MNNEQTKQKLKITLSRLREMRQKVEHGTFTGDKDEAIINLCKGTELLIEGLIK